MKEKYDLVGIINAHSRFCQNGLRQQVQNQLNQIASEVHITKDEKDIDEAIRRVNDRNLGLAGGDGSLVLTLSKYFSIHGDDNSVRVVYFPTGTHDKEAREIGIFSMLAFGKRRDSQRQEFIDQVVQNGKPLKWKKRNILRVECGYANGTTEKIYCFDLLAGTLVNQIMAWQGLSEDDITNNQFVNTRATYSPEGIASYIISTINQFLTKQDTIHKTEAQVTMDGHKDFGDYAGIFISTSRMVLPFIRPCYLADNYSGEAHVVASKQEPTKVVKALPRMVFGHRIADEDVTERGIREAYIEFTEPEIIAMSGEFRRVKYLKIDVLKDRVEFAVPPITNRLYLDNALHKIFGKLMQYGGDKMFRTMFDPSEIINGKKQYQ